MRHRKTDLGIPRPLKICQSTGAQFSVQSTGYSEENCYDFALPLGLADRTGFGTASCVRDRQRSTDTAVWVSDPIVLSPRSL